MLLKEASVQNLFIKCFNNCKHRGDHNVNNDSNKAIDNNETDRTSVRQIVEIEIDTRDRFLNNRKMLLKCPD